MLLLSCVCVSVWLAVCVGVPWTTPPPPSPKAPSTHRATFCTLCQLSLDSSFL